MSCFGCCSPTTASAPLGDVLAEIADALQVGRDAKRRHDLAQVVGERLAPGDHDDGLLLDLRLQLVDRLILLDGGGGEVGIAAFERIDGLPEDSARRDRPSWRSCC